MKTNRLSRSVVAFVVVVAVSAVVVAAPSARPAPETAPGDLLDPRTYAPDSRLYLILHAIGVQKYTCQANGTWLFTDPEATLYKTTTGASKPVGTHFLNFSTGRPVWQWKAGSSVEAARTQTAPGRRREHRLAAPAGGRDESRTARADHLDPKAEHDRRCRSGRDVYTGRHDRGAVHGRLLLLEGGRLAGVSRGRLP